MKVEVKEIPQPKHEYVLTLSEEEASAIRLVAGRIVGGGVLRNFYNDLHAKLPALESPGRTRMAGTVYNSSGFIHIAEGV